MSAGQTTSPLLETLLSVVFRQRIIAPDSEAGIACLAAAAGEEVTLEAWHAAVADAVGTGTCVIRCGCRPARYNATGTWS